MSEPFTRAEKTSLTLGLLGTCASFTALGALIQASVSNTEARPFAAVLVIVAGILYVCAGIVAWVGSE